MNTLMWHHPHTARQLQTLQELGIQIIDPISKTLACGDTGMVGCLCIYCIVLYVCIDRYRDKVKYIICFCIQYV